MPAAYDITHRYMAVSAYERHGAKKGHALLATALPTLVPQVGAPAGVEDRVPSLRSMFRFVASWRSRASLSQLDRRNRGRTARRSALHTPGLLAACIAFLWFAMVASATVSEKKDWRQKKDCNVCTCSDPKSEKYAPPRASLPTAGNGLAES